MGICKFCGTSAGLFAAIHRECEAKHQEAVSKLGSIAAEGAAGRLGLQNMQTVMTSTAQSGFVSSTDMRKFLVEGWERAAEAFLDDGIIQEAEERSLASFSSHYKLTQTELDAKGMFTKVIRSLVLKDIVDGRIPKRTEVSGSLPFNFEKNERTVFIFQNVRYLEEKKRRQYVGRSHGVSIRIAKGVYYRTGAFKGQPIDSLEKVYVGTGLLCVTTRNAYFMCPAKSLKIPHKKILTLQPYSDGVGIHRDAASAVPQIFVNGDGWFLYNVLANAPNVE